VGGVRHRAICAGRRFPSEIGRLTSETGCRTSETGWLISEIGRRTSEIGCLISEIGRRTSEIGCLISEIGGRTSEIGRPISGTRRQCPVTDGPISGIQRPMSTTDRPIMDISGLVSCIESDSRDCHASLRLPWAQIADPLPPPPLWGRVGVGGLNGYGCAIAAPSSRNGLRQADGSADVGGVGAGVAFLPLPAKRPPRSFRASSKAPVVPLWILRRW
jgi:hypothetical protein